MRWMWGTKIVVLIWEQRCVPPMHHFFEMCKIMKGCNYSIALKQALHFFDCSWSKKVNVSHCKFSRDHCKHTTCGDTFFLKLIQKKVVWKAECFMGSSYSNASHTMIFEELPAMNTCVLKIHLFNGSQPSFGGHGAHGLRNGTSGRLHYVQEMMWWAPS